MICNMEMVRKAGIVLKLHIQANSSRVKSTEEVDFCGKMEVIMKATLLMDNLKAMESTILQI